MTTLQPEVSDVVPILVVLLLGAAVEISVLVLVAQAIGVLPTLGLLLAGALLGTWLVKREGRRTLAEFRQAATARRPADREVSNGVLIAGGGLLILVPGLLSDIAGLVCLFPPTRELLRRRMVRSAERRAKTMRDRVWQHAGQAQYGGAFGSFNRGGAAASRDSDVIDGEVVSVSEDEAEGSSPSRADGDTPGTLPPHRHRPNTS